MTVTSETRIRIAWPPRIGVVIGTYGCLSLIRLQLELRRRYWPHVPLLIHDDCSPEADALRQACEQYGATFYSTPSRVGVSVGDMSCFIEGLDWAHEKGFDFLVKLSRRFVICHDWMPYLERLAYNTQAATLTDPCSEKGIGCRSECVAFHVESWRNSEALETMRAGQCLGRSPSYQMESWYYDQAVKIYHRAAPTELKARHAYLKTPPREIGIAPWNIVGYGRHNSAPGTVWHNSHFPEDYQALAYALGLTDVTVDEFRWSDSPAPDFACPEPALACPARGPDEAAIRTQVCRFERAGFLPGDALPDVERLSTPPRSGSLFAAAVDAHHVGRLGKDALHAIRALRAAARPFLPYTVSRSFADTWQVAPASSQSAFDDAVAKPRHEMFARYLCRKASEREGIVLTIGAHPAGLARHAALEYGRRLNILGVVEDAQLAAAMTATANLNSWKHLSIFTPKPGASTSEWVSALKEVPLDAVALILIGSSRISEDVLGALRDAVHRDSPYIVITGGESDRMDASRVQAIAALLAQMGYNCAATRSDGDAEGVMKPLDSGRELHREALFAWRRRSGSAQ